VTHAATALIWLAAVAVIYALAFAALGRL